MRSYQVDGSTNSEEMWWWEFGSCDNVDCWGPYERTLKFQRQQNRMRLSNFKKSKFSNNPPERLDQIFFPISQLSQNTYSGLACPVSLGGLFWPLFKNFEKKQQLHIHISMISKKILPEHVKFSEKKNYPSFYKNHPHYIYPHTIEFRIFGEVKAPLPSTIQELEDSGRPEIGRVFGFLYPGGAGLRMEHYKFLEGPKPEERRQTPEIPSWWPGWGQFAGYIKDFQYGWAGPVVSFWRRSSIDNGYFS